MDKESKYNGFGSSFPDFWEETDTKHTDKDFKNNLNFKK